MVLLTDYPQVSRFDCRANDCNDHDSDCVLLRTFLMKTSDVICIVEYFNAGLTRAEAVVTWSVHVASTLTVPVWIPLTTFLKRIAMAISV